MNSGAMQNLIEAIGWTLIHVTWQGILAAAAVALLSVGLPRAKPNLRYAIACGGLLAIALGGLVTFAVELRQHAEITRDVAARADQAASATEQPAGLPKANFESTNAQAQAAPAVQPVDWQSAIGQETNQFLSGLGRFLPAIVALWGIGVSLLSARLLLEWWSIRRVSSGRRSIEDPAILASLRSMANRLGMSRPVGLFRCANATVPFVLGWLKPAVLLPAELLTGLEGAELDAILAHELAHIRRYDYLVNLLQTLVETIYFYHPGVWWISRLMRREREFCCDDLAAMACGDRVVYGRALLALEQWRGAPARLQVAANGGALVERIRRLAGVDAARPYRPVAIVLVMIALFGAAVALLAVEGRAESSDQAQKVTVATIEPKNVTICEPFVARMHSHRHIDVRALQRGYLEATELKEGQSVKRGDRLFSVNPILYVQRADAENAELTVAKLELAYANKLHDDRVVSENEVALSKAKLQKAQAKAGLANAELDFATIKAPFDGVVGRLPHQQGSLILEGEALTTLSDNSAMWVYFNVPEARYLEYMQTKPTGDLKFELVLSNGKKFDQEGKLGAIEGDFNNENGSIPFRADFPNPDLLLRHGQTGTVLIRRELADAIAIPQKATFEVLQKRYVYVVDKDAVAHLREVVIQNEFDDQFVVKSGLRADDKIVIDGIRQVHDGEKVEYEDRRAK